MTDQGVEDPLCDAAAVERLGRWLYHRHRQDAFDVLLGYFVYPGGYLATCFGSELGVPVVCSCRGNDISKDMFIDPETIATVLQQSAALLFVSRSLFQMAETLVPCTDNSTVVDNSVDCTQFIPAQPGSPVQDEAIIVGTSGLLRWKKGIDVLLPLIRALCRTRHVAVKIAGYGLDAAIDQKMTEFLKRHQLQHQVDILGPLSHDRMPGILRQMDLYVTTSFQEGMPNGVLEAMACALPVVATAADGIPLLVEDGVTGFLCPVGDLESLVERCQTLIDQPELRRQMGTAGRDRALHRFHPDRETEAIERVLRQVCESYQSK